ncbi:acetyl-CoA carboxylase biotin carboxyl carrier protein subunit [Flammeovirga sp. SubArs3]|uniref:acetyl-CoA carboxylase biotin carboxyl carrier protein subunit n=1 Tax=Flammeovirga sp. SubArs3 TaxID=2995316 RepID=UPI00248BED92|nr:acetyl-CoA carboxylase biotin carboxyl carrier protein subunit [Flammeovirga sp. SubArs3]
MLTIKTKSNDHSVIKDKQSLIIDNKKIKIDLNKTHQNVFQVFYNNKSFDIEILKSDPGYKHVELKINGKKVSLQALTKLDELLDQLGMNKGTVVAENIIKAPMPGKVIELLCKVGDTVATGDNLIILEAMKMENILKAPLSGTIKKITAKEGESVEKGSLLIEIEE